LDHQNPADIDEDTIILVIIIRMQHHPVCCNKCNNFKSNHPFFSTFSVLEKSIPVDAIGVFDHQNMTNIDEDPRIPVIIM
jgi:hypothetical protein